MFWSKKIEIAHPVFGKLAYSDREFTGEILFPPGGEIIDIYFQTINKLLDESYVKIWQKIVDTFDQVLGQTVDVINEEAVALIQQESLKKELGIDNVSLEGMSYDLNGQVKLFWGIIDVHGQATTIQVVSSFNYDTGKVSFIGCGD
jgi:hypothetical protein